MSRWLHEQKKVEIFWILSVISLVTIGVAIPLGATRAAFGATEAVNYLLTFLAFILQWIIIMLGNLVIFLVNLVIDVSQYNSFVSSQPVQTGWPIVRDVINMFFIVVLLMSAFSTIIGYEKYHYKNIIKKFFLMAVLVNFSLPLFGIAIDFSQVLMLTFVNGFKSAAAGNFVTVLKLDQVMKIESSAIDLSPDNGSNPIENPMVKKVTAMMFGVLILGISATILAIMVVYLIARIVGLWVLLITSPGALFVTGLPSSLQGKIPGFGGEWWNKLWALLTGGPIMAFFLWLTLATAANVGPTFTKAQYSGSGEVQAAQNYFQTAIGNVENLGTYLVAIIMLFAGLQAAVSASGQVGGAAATVSKKIRDIGVGSTKFLAYGGMAAAGAYGARQVGGAVREVGAGMDRTYGFTKGFGSTMQSIGVRIGSTGLATTGAKIAGTRGRAVKRSQEQFEEQTKGLSTAKRMDFARKRMNSLLSNADERKGLSEILTKDAFSTEGQKHLLTQYEKEAKAQLGARPEGEQAGREYDQRVEAIKKMRLSEDRKKMLGDYQKAAGENEDKLKWIREKQEAAPSHATDVMSYVSGKMGDDPTYFRKIKADDFESGAVLASLMSANGFDGNNIRNPEGPLATAMRGNDKKAKLLRAMQAKLQAEADQRGLTVEQLIGDQAALNESGLMKAYFVKDDTDAAFGHRLVMSQEPGVAAAVVAPQAGAPQGGGAPAGAAPAAPQQANRNEAAIAEHRQAIQNARQQLAVLEAQPETPERNDQITQLTAAIGAARQGMIGAGASEQEAFQANREGRFEDPRDRQDFEMRVQNIFTEGKKDFTTYSKVNLDVINQNPQGDNEARRSLIRHTDVKDLGLSYALADAAKDKASRENIANIARAIDAEGSRHQSQIEAFNRQASKAGKTAIDTNSVISAARDYLSANTDVAKQSAEYSLQNAFKGSGIVMNMDDAIAIAKREDVRKDEALQHYTRHATGRAIEAVSRGKRAVKEGGSVRESISDATKQIKEEVQRAGQRAKDTKNVIRDVLTQQPRAGREVPEIEPPHPIGFTPTTRTESSQRRKTIPPKPNDQGGGNRTT